MKHILTIAFSAISIFSCSQQTPEIHKVNHEAQKNKPSQELKLANTVDPICNMKVSSTAKDTAVFKGKTYGFCSTYCKQEFKKNPKKHIK
jgi:YHS domain-containing protein